MCFDNQAPSVAKSYLHNINGIIDELNKNKQYELIRDLISTLSYPLWDEEYSHKGQRVRVCMK